MDIPGENVLALVGGMVLATDTLSGAHLIPPGGSRVFPHLQC
jgi:hypothetical protein